MQKTVLSGVFRGAIISGVIAHMAFTSHSLLSYETALLLMAFSGFIHSGFLMVSFNMHTTKWVRMLLITAFNALLFRVAGFLQTYQAGDFSLYFFYATGLLLIIGLVLTIIAYVMPASSVKQ